MRRSLFSASLLVLLTFAVACSDKPVSKSTNSDQEATVKTEEPASEPRMSEKRQSEPSGESPQMETEEPAEPAEGTSEEPRHLSPDQAKIDSIKAEKKKKKKK